MNNTFFFTALWIKQAGILSQ